MRTITNTFPVQINAKPEDVFDYVSDLTRHGEWNEGLRVEAMTAGSMSTGSQYRSWGNPGNRMNEIRITEYEPPTRFAFVASQIGFNEVRHEFTIHPQAGGTILERKVTAKMPLHIEILWRVVLWPLFDRPAMNRSLAALKAALEHSSS